MGGEGEGKTAPAPRCSPFTVRRWEEEYTVRLQLQERVNELQEVRAAPPALFTILCLLLTARLPLTSVGFS